MRVLVPRTQLDSAGGKNVALLDPSEFRPELKNTEEFRNYAEDNARHDIVRKTYNDMHVNMTFDYVQMQRKRWFGFDHAEMTIMEALDEMNKVTDESDPDVDVPNLMHAFQTAERIREKHPNDDWFHLVGLIHDIGKIMALYDTPQWCVVGDTFPVGCAFDKSIVFSEQFVQNKDTYNPKYNTPCGIYKEHCGLENVIMSFGHDEYLYQVLTNSGTTLPEEGLYMIRFHSFYPWHTSGAYDHLCNDKDREMLKWVNEFNQFDLYSKADAEPDIEALKPYYQSLIDKYMPGVIRW